MATITDGTKTYPMSALCWAVRTDVPYKMGHHHIILPDDSVGYTDHKSIESYAAERGGEYVVMSDSEFDKFLAEEESKLVTPAESITLENFWDLLECLPPCRWHHHAGIELFHVSERLTGDLVTWCAKVGEDCYSFTDQARAPSADLAAKVVAARSLAPAK